MGHTIKVERIQTTQTKANNLVLRQVLCILQQWNRELGFANTNVMLNGKYKQAYGYRY